MKTSLLFCLLFAGLLAAHFCHLDILWAEETLPMAAAAQMQAGKFLYRDAWFDKPPLLPAAYLLWGVRTGWALRLAGACYALLCCWLAYRFAREFAGARAGRRAAILMGAFLTFDFASAVMPLAADLLMLAPHIAAIHAAWRGKALLAGILAGVAFLINAKALFVLAACALWTTNTLPLLALGFALPLLVTGSWLVLNGALLPYWEQVWTWGRLYAGSTFVAQPLANGLVRTASWLGFHAVLVVGAMLLVAKQPWAKRGRWLGWIAFSFAAIALGWRFFPRYYFQLLPAFCVLGAAGIAFAGRFGTAALLFLLIPAARFAPRYAMLAGDLLAGRPHQWADVAMDRDSRAASAMVREMAQPGDTLQVWGFRPEMYIYTGLTAASRFLDSQAFTGVPADRHLTQSAPVETEQARANRRELAATSPVFIMDGLGLYNPALAIEKFPELRPWLSRYREVARSGQTVIYRLSP